MNDTSSESVTKSTDAAISNLRDVVTNLRESSERIQPNKVVKLIQQFETNLVRINTLQVYTYCKYASDTNAENSQTLGSLFYKLQNDGDTQNRLFDQIIGKMVQKNPEIIESSELMDYRYQLHKASQRLPYSLSQVKEELVAEKDTNGISAISQLRSSWVASQLLDVKINGEQQ